MLIFHLNELRHAFKLNALSPKRLLLKPLLLEEVPEEGALIKFTFLINYEVSPSISSLLEMNIELMIFYSLPKRVTIWRNLKILP